MKTITEGSSKVIQLNDGTKLIRKDPPVYRDWGIYEGGDLMPIHIFNYLRDTFHARMAIS